MAIDPALAVFFFVNAPAIAERLPTGAPAMVPDGAEAVAAALRRLPRERVPELLAELVPAVLAADPGLSDMLDEVRRRQVVRSASEIAQLLPAVEYVMDHAGVLAAIIVGLRLLGENRVKIGGVEIKTGSVLRELAELVTSVKSTKS
ncbi:hypothetical protein ABMY26_00950 [Azospirillum sp. HJ39]|uniref:hypothetical protein n=1 Tax=Azospirillum sp. HJ39 TaxID=3159496 RepID=UPI00355737E6